MKATGKKRVPAPRTKAGKSNGSTISVMPAALATRASADAVAALAHRLFIERGGAHGHDVEDWLEAERRLQAAAE
jgi:hypothetical protein